MVVKRMLIYVSLIALLFCGCGPRRDKYTYVFWKPDDEIVSIEILRKTEQTWSELDPVEVVHVIPEAEHADLLNKVKELPGEHMALEPFTGWGTYIIRITYQDGESAWIGYTNTIYKDSSGNQNGFYYFYLKPDSFNDLIGQIIGAEASELD